jgi:predicted ATP-grasp superfamily ATP-dependent carboligase
VSLAELTVSKRQPEAAGAGNVSGKVLVLGNDTRVGLALARGLGRAGLEVHFGWYKTSSPLLNSRYVSHAHRLPPYSADSSDWLDALHALVQQQQYDLVIPCNDYAVVPLQTERHRLTSDAKWYLLRNDAFRVAFDKAETSRVAAALDISIPKEHVLTCEAALQAAERGQVAEIDGQPLRFPVYVKPLSSVTSADSGSKRAVRRIDTPVGLAEQPGEECLPQGLLVQESF